MNKVAYTLITFLFIGTLSAQGLQEFPISEQWLAKITSLAPTAPRVKADVKKIMVFSQHTGFDHWTTPHNNEMLKILATKSGAFQITIAKDIASFDKRNLKQFDAVILNNSNPAGPKRDLFWDLLKKNSNLDDRRIAELAAQYERNLMDYVSKGGGLMILHGAITVQNNSKEFSKMVGGSFDYHPKQQEMHLKEVNPDHPMVRAFKGKGLTHVDEPYFFNNAYSDYNFRPLLYIEADKLEGLRKEVSDNTIYVSWIKRHGKGRVFYTSPSHNAQSMDNPELLQFFLDGMQYVTGDLKCDDSPIKIN
ncbi:MULTISPECIES: ThuA domain-containing protein [unclassified Arenibacter]|jgi:type 1 glutamine amidotransferase|uniref:ThuA domain-containing protein n=1 Tax=unclassified Arenibacter TaxID=2615047 RepID=UPI000E352B02|nr:MULTISPECIES: ThuA domain-containing protein [unclassified Arenibacter]MCM4162517.1 glycosyl hydrolase [Arenibacter sp. A80]RFT58100.1 ThuA domain-containing protein [Arenibacter sp. P308M17]